MTRFTAKHFSKNTAVKAIIFTKDKRIKTYYTKPEGNTLTINGKSYTINDQDWFINDGFPTYIFNDSDAQPKNPLINKTVPVMSPDDFNTAISSKVAKEIFEASGKGMDTATLSLIISFVTLGGVAVVGYLLTTNFESLAATVNEIREVLRIIGGQ
jgi:hypothetical protein